MKRKNQGSTLILVMILILVGTIAVLTFLGTTSSVLNVGGIFRRGNELKLQAQAGFEMAKAKLSQTNFTEEARSDAFIGSKPKLKNSLQIGLFYAPDSIRNCTDPTKQTLDCYTFFQDSSGNDKKIINKNYETKVYLLPDKKNPSSFMNILLHGIEYAEFFPKIYTIVSQSFNTNTGEYYTVTGKVEMTEIGFSRLSFGVLNPTQRLFTDNSFFYSAGLYEGQYHFGNFPEGTYPIFGQGEHVFKGPVTFAKTPEPEMDYPFDYNENSSTLLFNKGFVDNFKAFEMEPDAIYNQTADSVTTPQVIPNNADPSTKDVCLLFKTNASNEGIIEQRTCKKYPDNNTMMKIDPQNRYGSTVIKTWKVSENSVFVCGNSSNPCNLHVKGIVKGQFTVAADNIYLEGDIVYHNQDKENSEDIFGAVAKNNLVIPRGVPNGVSWNALRSPWGYAQDQEDPSTSRWTTGVWTGEDVNNPEICSIPNDCTYRATNFIAPTTDRDKGNKEYNNRPGLNEYWPQLIPEPIDENVGYKNYPMELDLDGSFIAAGGYLDLEGFNDTGYDPVTVALTNDFSSDPRAPEIKSFTSDGPTPFAEFDEDLNYYVRVDGMEDYGCTFRDKSTDKCLVGSDLIRAPAGNLWIFGGLITRDYSWIKVGFEEGKEWAGFRRRVILEDKRLANQSPPGFPKGKGESQTRVLWVKSHPGHSLDLHPSI